MYIKISLKTLGKWNRKTLFKMTYFIVVGYQLYSITL